MSAAAPLQRDTFAGNRAVGHIALTVDAALGVSRRRRVHESGSLRVRFPNAERPDTLESVIVNTAGGMTGGDRFGIDVAVASGAGLAVTTAAAEKIYRSLAPDTEIAIKLEVGRDGRLAWLPQETILFDQVRLRRSIDVALAPGAQLLLAEAIVFGRTAMGEAVLSGKLADRWRVRRDGVLVFAETVRFDGMIAEEMARPAVAAGGVAVANVLKIPGDDADIAAIRALADAFKGEVAASAWNGHAIIRFVARDSAVLRQDLMVVLAALNPLPLPRLWLN
ncbi:MAG TPA: urease accessory protein UreD [Xanthobacteraceae bacterium]|nr:urease accessory protein UreD [Xanthobacteraceae bacterium]